MRNFIFNGKIVVLHTIDLDSIGAAWSFLDCNDIAGKMYFQSVDNLNILPPGLEKCSVILCGFTFPSLVMHELINQAHFVLVLDNNIETLQIVCSLAMGFKNLTYVIDTNRYTTEIAWDFLRSSPLPSKIYNLISGHSLGVNNIFEFGKLIEREKNEDVLMKQMASLSL